MVSTFTPNKNIEKPGSGDYVGTWDQPVNDNMDLVDSAFGGVATVALTNANVTLSAAQYENVFLVFTGTITANIHITLPAVGSFYTVQNQTANSSAFYVTMGTTAASGQIIGIPPYDPTEIFTDGTHTKFRNMGRVGGYWDYAGSSVPGWVGACTVPPYLNCDGSTFSSATYPALAVVLGSTTLPDMRGRVRAYIDGAAARLTSSGVAGIDGDTLFAAGGTQDVTLTSSQMPSHDHSGTTGAAGTHIHQMIADTATDSALAATDQVAKTSAGGGYQLAGDTTAATLGETSSAADHTHTISSSGADGPHSNVQPTIVAGLCLIRAA